MKLSLPSAAAGAVLASASLLVVRVAVEGPVDVPGLPRAPDIVNIAVVGGTIPTGNDAVIYSVPSDKWLVITGCSLPYSSQHRHRVSQSVGGVLVPKFSLQGLRVYEGFSSSQAASPVSPLPAAFEPGSDVVMTYVGSSTPSVPEFYFSGYLEDI